MELSIVLDEIGRWDNTVILDTSEKKYETKKEFTDCLACWHRNLSYVFTICEK